MILNMMDYYNLLGVPPDASPSQIKQAFRARAKEAHPDAHPGLAPQKADALKRRFVLLAQAYDTLSDPERRRAYHRQWSARQGSGSARSTRAKTQGAAGPFRGTRAGFGTGRRERPRPATEEETVSVEDLAAEVEDVLRRFGLSLRPPFEELLDTLLDWARELFRQVAGFPDEPRTGGPSSARDEGGASGRSQTGAGKRGQGQKGAPGQGPAKGPGRPRAAKPRPRDTEVEQELADLKRRVGKKNGAPRRRARPEGVEDELRRLKKERGKS